MSLLERIRTRPLPWALLGVVVALPLIAFVFAQRASIESPAPPETRVHIKDFSYRLGGIGTSLIADFSIANGNAFPVRDVAIECTCTAPSGTSLSTVNYTLFERVDAQAIRDFRAVNMGLAHSQTAAVACRAVSVRQ